MLKVLAAVFLGLACASAGATEVVLRHALQGKALDALATLTIRFNDENKAQPRTKKSKGREEAKVILQDVRGVEDLQQLPHLALLDPDESPQFFGTRPRFLPLHQVMAGAKEKFDTRSFYPQVAGAADDLAGRIQGVPMALSLPVLFFNKEAFLKVGLDPEAPPKTWFDLQQAAGKLFDAGYKCPLTTSNFAWVHLENVSSQHGEPLVTREGRIDRVSLNNLVNVKHVALLISWHKSFYFHYFGPGREGDRKFASGECAMVTGQSSLYAELRGSTPFTVGVAELPYYDDVFAAQRADVLPDGASLWALPGKSKDEYKTAARFVAFLLRPENQRAWVQATGFLPMTSAAIEALRAAGVAPAVLDIAHKRLSSTKGAARTKNGERSRIRQILNEEIEFAWKNLKPAKEALDNAVARANSLLISEAKAAEPAAPRKIAKK